MPPGWGNSSRKSCSSFRLKDTLLRLLIRGPPPCRGFLPKGGVRDCSHLDAGPPWRLDFRNGGASKEISRVATRLPSRTVRVFGEKSGSSETKLFCGPLKREIPSLLSFFWGCRLFWEEEISLRKESSIPRAISFWKKSSLRPRLEFKRSGVCALDRIEEWNGFAPPSLQRNKGGDCCSFKSRYLVRGFTGVCWSGPGLATPPCFGVRQIRVKWLSLFSSFECFGFVPKGLAGKDSRTSRSSWKPPSLSLSRKMGLAAWPSSPEWLACREGLRGGDAQSNSPRVSSLGWAFLLESGSLWNK